MGVRVVTGAAGAVLGSALLVLVIAAPAHAHDVLVSTSPKAGAEVARVPSTVTLTFNEAVLGLGTAVVVDGPDGPAQVGKADVVDNTVGQTVRAGSPAGAYTVRWRATSSDGHPITGTFAFTARSASPLPRRSTGPIGKASSSATASATAVADAKKDPGSDTSWTKILLAGGAGAALGALYVLTRRRKSKQGS